MIVYITSVLALAALCAVWVALQLWLQHADPSGEESDDRCMRCGGCGSQEGNDPQWAGDDRKL